MRWTLIYLQHAKVVKMDIDLCSLVQMNTDSISRLGVSWTRMAGTLSTASRMAGSHSANGETRCELLTVA